MKDFKLTKIENPNTPNERLIFANDNGSIALRQQAQHEGWLFEATGKAKNSHVMKIVNKLAEVGRANLKIGEIFRV